MMEQYLSLFEEAIRIQSTEVGETLALAQAKRAGLSVSPSGHIVACTGNPALVLLRLIKTFTEDGNLNALKAIAPLIEKMSELQDEWSRTTV
jgi:hypothetical protein